MTTNSQIERMREYLFDSDQTISLLPSFDLHILLADFKDGGSKGRLISATNRPVMGFRDQLLVRQPAAGARLGNVLCMKLTTGLTTGLNPDTIELCWLDQNP